MDDLISRQAALNCFHAWIDKHGDVHEPDEIPEYEMIEALPTIQPMQKEAKWMTAYLDHESIGHRPRILYCSRCNQCAAYPTDFCPACGSDMRRII